jgi:hypothetical protein
MGDGAPRPIAPCVVSFSLLFVLYFVFPFPAVSHWRLLSCFSGRLWGIRHLGLSAPAWKDLVGVIEKRGDIRNEFLSPGLVQRDLVDRKKVRCA